MSGALNGSGKPGGSTVSLPLDPRRGRRGRWRRSSARRCCRRARSPTRPCSSGRSRTSSRGWICFGHASAVAEPGAYLMREIGSTSVFAMRGGGRGGAGFPQRLPPPRRSRIVTETEGRVRRRIQCPYHAWSYDLEGRLVAAPHMDEVEDFDRGCWGLIEIRSAVVGGLLLIDLSGEAPDPHEHVGDLLGFLERYRVPELRRASGTVYEVAANWKGIAENYNECLHCPGVHPELNALSDYRSRRGGLRRRRLVRRLDDAERGRRRRWQPGTAIRATGRRSRGCIPATCAPSTTSRCSRTR